MEWMTRLDSQDGARLEKALSDTPGCQLRFVGDTKPNSGFEEGLEI